jgi:hypothetical protein
MTPLKYSDEQVRALRERVAAGEGLAEVAKDLGMNPGFAWRVVHGQRRSNAPGPVAGTKRGKP